MIIKRYQILPDLRGKELEAMEESLSFLSSFEAQTEEEKTLTMSVKILGGYLSGERPSSIKKKILLAESLDSRYIEVMSVKASKARPLLEEKEQNLIEKARIALKTQIEKQKISGNNKLILSSRVLAEYFSQIPKELKEKF